MNDLALTPALFSIFSALIEERSGIAYALQDREILETKLSARMLDAGFESPLDYYYFLRYDPSSDAEFKTLLNTLVVNETFFFREFEPLQVAISHVASVARAGRRARIWCAACSTGEEPITVAMLLERHGLLDRTELIATDISAPALARAREGLFGKRSLRQVPAPELAAKWLEPESNGVRVKRELLAAVRWQELNLLDAASVRALGSFDLILCRNVLIYFRDSVAARVVEQLASQLVPGGALLVGVSESLLRFGSSLACEERSGVFLYRKPPA